MIIIRPLIIQLISLSLFACSTTGEINMQQRTLLTQIQNNQAPVIVDVRSTMEYRSGHLPGAIHIPFWQALTTDKLTSYPKNQPIILYCQHGPRAGIAKLALYLNGFSHIDYLAGHMSAWEQAKLPVEKSLNE